MKKVRGRMKKVEVKFKKLEVARVFSRDNAVEIRLILNDGKDKSMNKSVKLDNVADIADELVKEVREKLQTAHKTSGENNDILSGVVILSFKDDEDIVMDKITRFLASVREKMKAASTGRMTYYDVEMQIKRNNVEF